MASERSSTSGSFMCAANRMRWPSSAPPLEGDDGPTARNTTRRPRSRYVPMIAAAVIDLPMPMPGQADDSHGGYELIVAEGGPR